MQAEIIRALVDRHAPEADHIVPVNRVKPHISIRGPAESGLLKMLVIGLGKDKGTLLAHRPAVDVGLGRMVPEIARASLSKLPVLFGVAGVENARHQTAIVAPFGATSLIKGGCRSHRLSFEKVRAGGYSSRLPQCRQSVRTF